MFTKGCLNPAKTTTQKARLQADIVPEARFNATLLGMCGDDPIASSIPAVASFQDFYSTFLFSKLVKDDSSRGQSQYVAAVPSLYRSVKQRMIRELLDQQLLLDVVYTVYEADAHIANIAKQGMWGDVEIGAVLSQVHNFFLSRI